MKRGLKPPAPQAGPDQPTIPSLVNPFVVPCAWLGADGPCLLPGEIGQGRYDGDKFWCGWHGAFLVLGHDMALVGNREEFERWIEQQRKRGYDNVWAHHDSSSLWFALQGVAQLGAPAACGRPDCKWGKTREEVPF